MSNNSVYMLLHSYDYVFIELTLFHFFVQKPFISLFRNISFLYPATFHFFIKQPFIYLFRNQVEIKLGIRFIDKSNMI